MGKLDRLDTFVRVVEANSFIAIAKEMRVSNAAISKQIAALEKELNIQLLIRSTRSVALTDAGKLYFEHAKKMIHEMNEVEALVSEIRAEPSGKLNVIISRYFSEKYVVPHLKEFSDKFPKVKLNIELAERMPDFKREEIDLMMGMCLPGPQDCIQRKLATVRYVLCASPDYLNLNGTPKVPKNLVRHKYITHSMRCPDDVLTFKDGKEVRLEPYLRLNDIKTMKECAIQGMGIVKVHDYVVSEAIEKGLLVELLKEFMEPSAPLYLCYPQSRYLAPKIRVFIDFILEKLQK